MTRHYLLPLLMTATVAACAPHVEQQPSTGTDTPVAVTIVKAAVQQTPRTFEAGGIVRARTTAAIASRIVATVLAVTVAPGDRVHAGQPLVTLDSRDLEANRLGAAATVAALEQASAASMAERDAAQAAFTLAEASHQRIAALAERRSATAHELDEAVSTKRGADARVRAAGARIAETAASLEAARQAAASAEVAASFAVITAPFAGVITETMVDPGNLASPGVPLVRLDDTRGYRLEASIDASRAAGVARGDSVDVTIGDAGAGGESVGILRGRVVEIARAVDAPSHSLVVKIELPSNAGLRSGLFGRARFTQGVRDALLVPRDAVMPQGQLSTVFVVSSDGVAHMRVVDTGEADRDRVEILAGLAAGDEVVSSPLGVRDGDHVRPLTPAAGADRQP